MPEYHKPVLLDETLSLLNPRESGVFLDATVGGGGHAAELLERIGPEAILVGIDRDAEALEYTRQRLKDYGDRVKLVQGNFRDLRAILGSLGINELDGAVFDLGVSSHQLNADRGFSFTRDEELDMRMSRSEDIPTAADIVNSYSEHDLADIIWRYGEERYSRRIARAIVQRRGSKPFTTTKDLADVITAAIPGKHRWGDIHPATRSFQGIRIAVNSELESVETGVPAAIEMLKPGGRICVISFHSLEDRIIKTVFRRYAGRCECPPRLLECVCGARKMVEIITRKPVIPGEDEIGENPRSRSAKLRCAERLA
ncbi:MAG: 16S rRNA (cytosine(1402)-N(4))-methyltransferase RsmH [Armatimonadota bacterium]|nr:16S rRNA (cytosine(1402)-N(4))-methyltransferase RsmH [bacterium]